MKEIKPYEHRVQYYETDQMGIVHHSNYIRWFEEARTYVLEEMGFGYKEMEHCGIISPVLAAVQNIRPWYIIMIWSGSGQMWFPIMGLSCSFLTPSQIKKRERYAVSEKAGTAS